MFGGLDFAQAYDQMRPRGMSQAGVDVGELADDTESRRNTITR